MGAEGLKTASSIASLIFGTAYLAAIVVCISRSRNAWLKTHLLLAPFVHSLLRLASFILILLRETGVLFLGADIACVVWPSFETC
jgi:glucose-6-phosphate-specific signal transduction histidine kinase